MNLKFLSIKRPLLLFILLLIPGTAFTQDYSRPLLHLNWLITDPINLVANTNGAYIYWNAGIIGTGYLASLPDDFTRDFIQENWNSDGWMSFYEFADSFGEEYPIYLSAGLYSLGTAYGNTKLQDAAFTSIQSRFYVKNLTRMYKQVAGRTRPNSTDDNRDFSFFSGEESFPSGHTSGAFAVMSPWFFYYPRWYTALLFAAPIATGIARIGQDKHWTSDVLAGAALGTCTGYYLTKLHQSQDHNNMVVIPVIGTNNVGIQFSLQL
ncbi:MAG: phosphatase PAP2 family protein [Spirochaetales bacterium]|nr:phosphatase PAP2 family protein [Spirochaetales bacterium]